MQPASDGELVVLSWGGPWDRALRSAVSDPFEAATGIAVRHRRYVGLSIPDEVGSAVREGERPPCDVAWTNAVAAMQAAHDGWCDPMAPDEVPNLELLHGRARPDGFAGWPLVMVYSVAYVLVYRRALFGDHRPDSWQVLSDPRHQGRVALYPDGNGIHAVAQVLGGGSVADIPNDMTACWSFLRRMRPQVSAMDYSGHLGARLRAGELDLCFRALPNAIGFQQAGLDVDWVAPAEGVPDTMDCLWMPRGVPADAAGWARRYIDFALSRPVQEHWCRLLGTVPVRPDAVAPSILGAASQTPDSLDDQRHLLYVPDSVKMVCAVDWQQEFRSIFAV
jgi:putative spermidine/putrescine transport system substrate-binding protein